MARDAARADRLFAEAQREFEQVENAVMRYQLLNGLAAARQGTTGARRSLGRWRRDRPA